MAGRLEGEFGSVRCRGSDGTTSEPWLVMLIEKQTDPAVLRKLEEVLNGPTDSGQAHRDQQHQDAIPEPAKKPGFCRAFRQPTY